MRRIKLGFTGFSGKYLAKVRVKFGVNKFQFKYIYCISIFQISYLYIKNFDIKLSLRYLNNWVSLVIAQPIPIVQLI